MNQEEYEAESQRLTDLVEAMDDGVGKWIGLNRGDARIIGMLTEALVKSLQGKGMPDNVIMVFLILEIMVLAKGLHLSPVEAGAAMTMYYKGWEQSLERGDDVMMAIRGMTGRKGDA